MSAGADRRWTRLPDWIQRAAWAVLVMAFGAPTHDPDVAADYDREGRRRCRRGARALGLAIIPFILAGEVVDALSGTGVAAMQTAIRCAMVLTLAAVLRGLRSPWGERFPRELALGAIAAIAIGMELLAVDTDGALSVQHGRLNLLILGAAMLLTWSPAWAAASSAAVVGIHVAVSILDPRSGTGAPFLAHLGYLLASSAVAVFVSGLREADRWKDFTSSRELAAARRARAEEHHRYQSLVETAGGAIVVLAPDLRILEFNPAAERLFARARADVLGRSYLELIVPPSQWHVARAFVQKVLAGRGTHATEGTVRRPDATTRVVVWKNTCLRDAAGAAVALLAVGQDVTELEQAKRALRKSEARLRRLVETTRAIPWEADAETWRCSYIGPQAVQVLGYPLEQWSQPGFWVEHIHPEDRARVEAMCRASHERRDAYDFEYRMVAANGRVVWLHDLVSVERVGGKTTMLRGLLVDITDRKAAEQALRESEERLRRLVESTDAVPWEADARTWQVTYIGPQIERLLGYPVERCYAPGFWMQHLHPEDRRRAKAMCAAPSVGRRDFDFEYRIFAADGRCVWMRAFVSVEPGPDSQPRTLRGVLVDVTAGKQAEEEIRRLNAELEDRVSVRTAELAASEKRFRSMFETAPVAIAALGADGRVTTNPAFHRLLGYTADQLDGKTVHDFTHPDDVARSEQVLESLWRGESETQVLEKRYIRRDGSPLWGRVAAVAVRRPDGAPDYVFAMIRDVTRRKHREALGTGERRAFDVLLRDGELNQALRVFLDAIEACEPEMRLAVRVRDPDSERLQLVVAPRVFDGLVAATCGVGIGPAASPSGRAAHTGALVVVPDMHLDPTCAGLAELAAQHGLRALWSQPITTPPGALVGTLVVLHPASRAPTAAEVQLLADAGHVAGIIIEHKQTDELLRTRQAQLARVGRLGLIGALSAGIAHEVHQPLTAIVDYAGAAQQFLETPDLDRDSVRYLVGQMRHAALRGGETIRRIRGFLRSGELRLEWADLNEVAREAARFGEFEARRRGVTVRYALDPELPSVAVDVVQIQQVVLNLLTNAIEAMAETPADTREVELRSRRESDGSVEITVRDRGPGLPAQNDGRLFEPLFSTKSLGSGLGLAICRAIVEAHEGRIWARTNPEGGSTFGFRLPPPSADTNGRDEVARA